MVILSFQVIFDCLRGSGVVHVAASEENPVEIDCGYQPVSSISSVSSIPSIPSISSPSGVSVSGSIGSVYGSRVALLEGNSLGGNTPEEHSSEHSSYSSQSPGYSVAFDPLDGSSIVDANFAVGTIVGIWPGKGLFNRRGSEQVRGGWC